MNEYNKENARNTTKSISSELISLNPSTLLTFFELDISSVEKKIQDNQTPETSIIRFHNNKEIFSTLTWQGKVFHSAPISAEGFDISSRGTLPTPKLSLFINENEEEVEAFSLLRNISKQYGDIIGAKVTRIRTFLKYIDEVNFQNLEQQTGNGLISLPKDYEPNPHAELPRDTFYIERKTSENPTSISFELASLIDLEGVKLPRRVVTSSKCSFKYRGCGCFYEYDSNKKNLLDKCDVTEANFLPDKAPAVANNQDESIESIIGKKPNPNEIVKEYNPKKSNEKPYQVGHTVFVNRNGINYYYVLKQESSNPPPPPNEQYWVADACSKSLTGCRLRWGMQSNVVLKRGNEFFKKGELQFGGFPNATRINEF